MNNSLDISLRSDTFIMMKADFDQVLSRTIRDMKEKGADEASVTLKLNIGFEDNELDTFNGVVKYKKPKFRHEVSSVIAIKSKVTGEFDEGDFQIAFDEAGDKYVLVEVDDGQLSFVDKKGATFQVDAVNPTPERKKGAKQANLGPDGDANPFGYLKQFIDRSGKVTELAGHIVAICGDDILLTTDKDDKRPVHVANEDIVEYLGTSFDCIGYGDEDELFSVAIECKENGDIIYDVDKE